MDDMMVHKSIVELIYMIMGDVNLYDKLLLTITNDQLHR